MTKKEFVERIGGLLNNVVSMDGVSQNAEIYISGNLEDCNSAYGLGVRNNENSFDGSHDKIYLYNDHNAIRK